MHLRFVRGVSLPDNQLLPMGSIYNSEATMENGTSLISSVLFLVDSR